MGHLEICCDCVSIYLDVIADFNILFAKSMGLRAVINFGIVRQRIKIQCNVRLLEW